jgi:hypothetical protein
MRLSAGCANAPTDISGLFAEKIAVKQHHFGEFPQTVNHPLHRNWLSLVPPKAIFNFQIDDNMLY